MHGVPRDSEFFTDKACERILMASFVREVAENMRSTAAGEKLSRILKTD